MLDTEVIMLLKKSFLLLLICLLGVPVWADTKDQEIKHAFDLNSQAIALDQQGKYPEALPLYQRSLEIYEKEFGHDHVNTAIAYDNLAWLYSRLSQYDKALPLFQKALTIREKVLGGEHIDTASSLGNLAMANEMLGQYDKALPLYQRALAIRERVLGANHADTAVSLGKLAAVYKIFGQNDKALPLFLRALAINEKLYGSEHISIVSNLNHLASLYSDVGQYETALSFSQRSLAVSEKILGPEHGYTASSIALLAETHVILGHYELALPLYLRALPIYEKNYGEQSAHSAGCLQSLAQLYFRMGKYDKALPMFQRALAIREKVHGSEHPYTATSLGDMSTIYQALGQYDKALPLQQRALAIREKAINAENMDTVRSLNGLASLYHILGQNEKALILNRRALEISEKVLGPESVDTALCLNNISIIYQSIGQYNLGLPYAQRALEIREKIFGAWHVSTANGLYNLALLYQGQGQYDRALPLYQRALRISAIAGVPDQLHYVQNGLASCYAWRGEPNVSIFFLKSAVNSMQSIRSDARGLDKNLQKSLLKKNEAVYKQLAQLLVAAGRLAEAQQVLSMLKEDEYFDFIRRDAQADTRVTRMSYSGAERPYADKLDKLGNEGARLFEQLNTLNKQAKLGLTKEEANQLTNIKAKLVAQEQQTLALLNDIPQQLPAAQQKQLDQQRTEQAQLAAGIQKQLAQLGQGVTLIQYLLLGDKIQILLTDAKQQIVREAPIGEAALYPKLVELRKVLEDPGYDPRPLAQELYQSLIAPIETDIKNSQTLMLSLDGALRYIPFSALYDGKRYLVERYQLALYTAAAKDKLSAASNPQWKISGLGVTQAHPGFVELPGVKDELEGIIGKDGIPGETHLDKEFTATQMQVSLKQGNPVLHLASHFQFTPGTEADSYLLLGDGNHLSLKDIRQGDYPFGKLDLLTLSACATAMHGGQEANGKEVEGFGALAQNKGAKGVLATLWPIADASTAQLMQTLYRGRQQQHMNKAEALRQAQLALLRGDTPPAIATTSATPDKRSVKLVLAQGNKAEAGTPFEYDPDAPFSHPFFWAPFILMGNWL
jgi:CHAT domain-containing protein/tetratricopeptide (TPR) repeat protein